MKHKLTAMATTLAMMASVASADPVTLKFAHFWPTAAGPHADFALDWTKEVTDCTNGEVTFEFHTGGSQLGSVPKLEDFLRAGLVDVAHGLNHAPRNRFEAATIIDTPLLAGSAQANSNTLWTLFEEGLISAPYKGLKVLALHAHGAGLIHTVGKEVRVPDDLKGLRIRTPAPSVALWVKALGGIPVGVPPSETYEVLAKGTADGTVFPWEAVFAFKLADVLKTHTEVGVYSTSFWFAMNENSYSKLSESQQSCVDAASYRPLVEKFGDYWVKWDAPGKALAEAAGNTIIVPTEDEMVLWREAMEPVIVEFHQSLTDAGVADVDKVYARAKELVAEYDAK